MHYFQHHIGDFRAGCFNMNRLERALYREMLDIYYDTESPLPDSIEVVCKLLGVRNEEEKKMVNEILMLKFEQVNGRGWVHDRCEKEIASYHAFLEKSSRAGKASAEARAKKKARSVQPESNQSSTRIQPTFNQRSTNVQPTFNVGATNQQPLTNNQEKPSSSEQSPDQAKKRKWGSDDDHKTAQWIFSQVRRLNPDQKEPNWDGWADDVRLMRERDGRSHKQICELFKRANSDSFWKSNVLSPGKLREKWDSLSIKLNGSASADPIDEYQDQFRGIKC